MINKHVCKVLEDPDNPGELALDFPDALMERMGWEIGTELEFIEQDDLSWIISKVEK